MEKKDILDITFLTPNLGWEKRILFMLGSSQKTHYWDSPLHVKKSELFFDAIISLLKKGLIIRPA